MALKREFYFSGAGEEAGTRRSVWSLGDSEGEGAQLTVEETVKEKSVDISIDGSLRGDMACVVKDELMALASADADVTVDCEKLGYFSNTCIKAFIEVQRFMDRMRRGTLTIQRMPAEIMGELRASGLSDSLMIE